MVGGNSFAKTICSICYEDLKPIAEDLQSISVCGHVFHELCLQQWLEYCGNGKKNCPVCKQNCSKVSINRLYFQSVGDGNDLSQSQTTPDFEENEEELNDRVKRLEAKISGLTFNLEHQQKDFKVLNTEIYTCKEQLKKEVILKNEALKQKAVIQQSLQFKSAEIDRLSSECVTLQNMNISLAKELAALKLVSELNLDEEGVLRLASLGNEANNKETIDILKKSLVVRNKSYKELMEKCNLLGRGEARSVSKLETAKEKIKRLKKKVQELETALEVKDNEALRALKASNETCNKVDVAKGYCSNLNSSSLGTSIANKINESFGKTINLDETESLAAGLPYTRQTKRCKPSIDIAENENRDGTNVCYLDRGTNTNMLKDVDSENSACLDELFCTDFKSQKTCKDSLTAKCSSFVTNASSHTNLEALVHRLNKDALSSSRNSNEGYLKSVPSTTVNEDNLVLDAPAETQPLVHITRGATVVPVFQPGYKCFTGGLMGPDGTSWHLGKWCKRVQNKSSKSWSEGTKELPSSKGDLIATGADGRGGQIKVLRSLNQSSLGNETLSFSKRCKNGSNKNGLQSQGCLQIEHYFGRSGQK